MIKRAFLPKSIIRFRRKQFKKYYSSFRKSDKNFAYANEADMLNLIVFGKTSKQWKEQNPEMSGNLRDQASVLELNILNNLQSRNSELIDNGVESELRFRVLLQIAQKQFERLGDDERLSGSKGFLFVKLEDG